MQIGSLPGKHTASARQTIYATGVVLLLALFVLVAYTFLHEGGHAILGLLFGGTITEFSINFLNRPHTGIEGDFTTIQNCAIAAAGVSLPLLTWAIFVSLAPRRSNMVVDSVRLIASLALLNTLLAWIIIPVLFMGGGRPGDDSTNFLNYSGVQPLVVTGAALLIYTGGWALYLRRTGGLQAVRDLVDRFRFQTGEFSVPAATRMLLVLVGVGSVIAASSWGLSAYLSASNPLGLPSGYSHVATLDLGEKAYAGDAVYRFSVDGQATAAFYIVLQDISSGPIDISLVGPNGYRNTFIKFGAGSGGGLAMGRATVHPKDLALEDGEYELQVTVPKSPGRIVVSTKIDGPEAQSNRP